MRIDPEGLLLPSKSSEHFSQSLSKILILVEAPPTATTLVYNVVKQQLMDRTAGSRKQETATQKDLTQVLELLRSNYAITVSSMLTPNTLPGTIPDDGHINTHISSTKKPRLTEAAKTGPNKGEA